MTHRRPLLLAVAALALSLAACGGGDDDGDAGDGGSDGASESATVEVVDNAFEPETVTVVAGGTVTWEWTGSAAHNVSADDFESELQDEGTFEHTFDEAGTFEYVCTVHPTMEGEVEVVEG